MRVILDVSRLLFSVSRATPSGIDRVEMAYVRHWSAQPEAECGFAAQSLWGWFAAVDRAALGELAATLSEAWTLGGTSAGPTAAPALRRARGLAVAMQARLATGGGRRQLADRLGHRHRPIFLIASHHALDSTPRLAALRQAGARLVPFVHDLIPLTHPEYTRPLQVRRHMARVATIVALADGIIVNSAATAQQLQPCFGRARRGMPPLQVAPLGIERMAPPLGGLPTEPYFVCLGTIEPRKNHLLLLQLWRGLVARLGPRAPRLLLIGRRGWENEHILRMLDRCTSLRGTVQELGALPDAPARRLLAGARALLFPSFAEGYGLPLAEALALGVPAIAADLPALREVGGAVPDYLDPADGAAWGRAILDYATPGSAARAAQLRRLESWQPPGWEAHFAAVDRLLDRVAGAPLGQPGVAPAPRSARPRQPAAAPA
ncbi:capsular polysaccharide glycosyltransferase biosynthesis protein [Siccirubricoccus deserti]|uniref:glycosyltransferase family 4 protein n=1 Tax=Siccirubricoccus deserti TaxID=2013562 RepID=UPI001645B7CD|nr:glycosyltransferase family 1 protein [Siccirubricoccus deserti]GGC56414.1 capsular polysaccharide glycosyltransferase biosynthesis protein [Siccirubricoccus deserti]